MSGPQQGGNIALRIDVSEQWEWKVVTMVEAESAMELSPICRELRITPIHVH